MGTARHRAKQTKENVPINVHTDFANVHNRYIAWVLLRIFQELKTFQSPVTKLGP